MPIQSLTREQLMSMYTTMSRIRACDEAIRKQIGRGKLVCFHFSYAGQEAIPTAMVEAIKPDDYFVVTYRGMHHQLAKGVSFSEIMGEMAGTSTGMADGKSGAMHIFDPSVGLMLTTGVVGAGLPPAVGLALASKIRGDGKVTICFHGDGATNTGSYHEAMNMAAVWDLPVVFVCENNRYAETVPTSETLRCTMVERASAYGMHSETVDGYDPVALYEVFKRAVEKARAGEGPSSIDATCYRYFGHYFGDPMDAVPAEELAEEKAKDPFEGFTAALIDTGEFNEGELAEIKSKADEMAQATVQEGIDAPVAPVERMYEGVYANPVEVR